MLSADWKGQGGLDGLDFSYDIAVATEMVFDGERLAILEPFQDAFVVHVLSGRWNVYLIAFLEEKIDGCTKEVETAEISVGFSSESAGRFSFGVAGDEGVKICFALDATRVGSKDSADGTIRAECKVAGAYHA